MRLHPVISILLAAWFGLGSTLGPRFLCSCADGTVTVEVGHPFCCDSDNDCCDSCDCDEFANTEPGATTLSTLSCADGCESTLLSDDAVTNFDRADEEQLRPAHQFAAYPSPALFETPQDRSFQGVKGRARIPTRCATGTSQLRSVILLV